MGVAPEEEEEALQVAPEEEEETKENIALSMTIAQTCIIVAKNVILILAN